MGEVLQCCTGHLKLLSRNVVSDAIVLMSILILSKGSLCPDPSSRMNTLMSRLRALWRHVRKSRADFENEPETGLLGKSFTRHLNRGWNYVIKGALGSSAIVGVMGPCCLLTSLASLFMAFTAPAW
jgi:hypothetical protein